MNVVGIVGQAKSGKDTVADVFVAHKWQKVAFADPCKLFLRDVFSFSDNQLWGASFHREKHDTRYTWCGYEKEGVVLDYATPTRDLLEFADANWAAAAAAFLRVAGPWLNRVLPVNLDPKEAFPMLAEWFVALGHDHPKLRVRDALQTLGSGFGRDRIDEDLWVGYFVATVQHLSSGYSYEDHQPTYKVAEHLTRGVICPDVRFVNEMHAIRKMGGRVIKIVRPDLDMSSKTYKHESETEQSTIHDSEFGAIIYNDKSLDELLEATELLVNIYNKGKYHI